MKAPESPTSALPETVEPGFVRTLCGVALPPGLRPEQILKDATYSEALTSNLPIEQKKEIVKRAVKEWIALQRRGNRP
jgi:hypothetical protein